MAWPRYGYLSRGTQRRKVGENGSEATLLPNPSDTSILSNHRWTVNSSLYLILCIYSTGLSGTWLALSLLKFRYEYLLQPAGPLSSSTLRNIIAFFSKTIEISFVAMFTIFLGQVLTRRSTNILGGISLAQTSMRTWVSQPGSIFMQWSTFLHAGLSPLGIMCILAAFAAFLYTTASSVVVSPHWIPVTWPQYEANGTVQARFASLDFLEASCRQSFISPEMAILSDDTTCLSLSQGATSYYGLLSFLDSWYGMPTRYAPKALGIWPAAQGTWIVEESSNVTSLYKQFSRIVNNVTLAMPHSIVSEVVLDLVATLGPEFSALSSATDFSFTGAVASPSSNVLCANLESSEIAPVVYSEWPNAELVFDQSTHSYLPSAGWEIDVPSPSWPNSTVVDDIFGWGVNGYRPTPICPMWPEQGGAILNNSVPNSDSVYVLLKSPTILNYTVCQIRVFMSYGCSTNLILKVLSMSGQTHMVANCSIAGPTPQYWPSANELEMAKHDRLSILARDALEIWAENVGLGMLLNQNSSTSPAPKLLSQMIQSIPDSGKPTLNPTMPFVAEGISALLASFLVQSTYSSTFKLNWNASDPPILTTPRNETSNATFSGVEFKASPVVPWQKIFYLVLLLVFAGNLCCLGYFVLVLRGGLGIDCTEPQNAFAFAVGKESSGEMSRMASVVSSREQLTMRWYLRRDELGRYFFSDRPTMREAEEVDFQEGLERKFMKNE